MPVGPGLFTPIDTALKGDAEFIILFKNLWTCIEDWCYFVHHYSKNPTSVYQLHKSFPSYIGLNNACKLGAGGVLCSGTSPLYPVVWQVRWLSDIVWRFVSSSNKTGFIDINDLELVGLVLNWLAFKGLNLNLKNKHIATYCNNISAVSWAYKLRASTSPMAGRLLHLLGIRTHASQASSLTPLSIPGKDNEMADISSRAFREGKYFHATSDLISYFSSSFPLPQSLSWQQFTIPTNITSRVIACLCGKQFWNNC